MSEYSPTASIDDYNMMGLQARYDKLRDEREQYILEVAATREEAGRMANELNDENRNLRDELRGKEEIILELRDEVVKLRRDVKEADRAIVENEKLRIANNKLKDDNQNNEKEIDKLKYEKTILLERIESINRSVKDIDEKLKRKEKVIEESQNQRWIMERSNSELKAEMEQISSELDAKSDKIVELEEYIQSTLQSQLNNANTSAKLINQINELTEYKAAQAERLNELDQQNIFLREKMGEFQQQLRNRESETRIQLSDLEQKMIDIKNVIESIGVVTQKTKTVRQTKLLIQKDVRGAISNLQRVISSTH